LSEQNLRDMAGFFLFRGDDVFRQIESFSGGEQSRLALALLILGRNNVLLLDEPTNHLDIPSREALEEALLVFPGSVIVVSHDRFFLDRVVTRILSFEGRTLVDELGRYSELRRQAKIVRSDPLAADGVDPGKQRRREEYEKRRKNQRTKESNHKRIAQLEKLAREQEEQIEDRMVQMADPAKALDWEDLERLQAEKKVLEKEHEATLAEWEGLMAQVEDTDE
jgi:ATP-binding cassette subfamily F protein 3